MIPKAPRNLNTTVEVDLRLMRKGAMRLFVLNRLRTLFHSIVRIIRDAFISSI